MADTPISQLRFNPYMFAYPSSPPRIASDSQDTDSSDQSAKPSRLPAFCGHWPDVAAHDLQEEMLDAHNGGVFCLLKTLIDIDKRDPLRGSKLKVGDLSNPTAFKSIVQECLIILSTIKTENIAALIRGKPEDFDQSALPKDAHPGLPGLQGRVSVDERPTIYIHYLVDSRHRAPSPEEWEQAIQLVENHYVKGFKSFRVGMTPYIDPQSLSWIKKIERALSGYSGDPTTGQKRYLENNHHLEVLNTFITNLRDRLKKIPKIYHGIHCPWVSFEVGYAAHPYRRMLSHKKHESSVPLMNLMDAVFQVLFPQRYKMHFRVFYEIPDEGAVSHAEHLISRLASSYITMGGYNSYQAGISVATSAKLQVASYRAVANSLEKRFTDTLTLECDTWKKVKLGKLTAEQTKIEWDKLQQERAVYFAKREEVEQREVARRVWMKDLEAVMTRHREVFFPENRAYHKLTRLLDAIEEHELIQKLQFSRFLETKIQELKASEANRRDIQ